MEYPQHLKDLSGDELKVALKEHRKKEIINLICRQTDYTKEKALERFEFWKENYLYVLKEYMNPNFDPYIKKPTTTSSMNQRVFGEIRNFMDQGEKLLAFRKRKQKQIQRLMAIKKQEEQNKKLKVIEEGNQKIT